MNSQVPWATWAIVAVCTIFAFLVTGFVPTTDSLDGYWLSIDLLDAGKEARLLSHMFVHGGILHFALNMMTLLGFGPQVERRVGPWAFLGLYSAAGILGGIVQVNVSPAPVVGASGAIFGLTGFLLLTNPQSRILVLFLPVKTLTFATWYLLAFLFFPFFNSLLPIAHGAHIGGLFAGFAVGCLLERRVAKFTAGGVVLYVVGYLIYGNWWFGDQHVPISELWQAGGFGAVWNSKWPLVVAALLTSFSAVYLEKSQALVDEIHQKQIAAWDNVGQFECARCGSSQTRILNWRRFFGKSLSIRCLTCKHKSTFESGRYQNIECSKCRTQTAVHLWENEKLRFACSTCKRILKFDARTLGGLLNLKCGHCEQVFRVNGHDNEVIRAQCPFCWRTQEWT